MFAAIRLTKIRKMWQLNLPSYQFNIKKEEDKLLIFDTQRKRFVRLTPEEWVRQNFIRYLIEEKNYPFGRIAVETQVTINQMKKRCDAIVYDKDLNPVIIIEFKSPTVALDTKTLNQVAVYNYKLHVDIFILSNGLQHFYFKKKADGSGYSISTEIPVYQEG